MKTVYDEKIWQQLRETWENTPSAVGWTEVCRMVSAACMSEVPVPEVVSKKAKREGWKKKRVSARKSNFQEPASGRKPAKQVVGKVVGTTSDTTSSNAADSSEKTEDCIVEVVEFFSDDDGRESEKSNIVEFVKKDKINRTSINGRNDPAFMQRKASDVVRAYKRRLYLIGLMLDDSIDTMLEAGAELKSDEASEEQKENALRNMQIASGTAETAESLSKTVERMAKMDIVLNGIDESEFKAQQVKARNAEIEKNKLRLKEAESNVKRQQKEMVARQQQLLANGGNLPQDAAMAVGDNGGN